MLTCCYKIQKYRNATVIPVKIYTTMLCNVTTRHAGDPSFAIGNRPKMLLGLDKTIFYKPSAGINKLKAFKVFVKSFSLI